ncbi:hypothetical protein Taro_028020 [Colocasia esculenta]|uniref:Uncharacterized protein n=1 Tax=Colocasia esculenta TaxID=4460 RepID=A0A843VG14_COLES|nr:hypothetical protein [Colocasia esculenta]
MGSRGMISRKLLMLSFLVAVLALEVRGGNAYGAYSEPGRRNLVEEQKAVDPSRTLDRTARVDPLDGFKRYRGGYNITNKHYWSSTIFTGIYGYGTAVLFLLGGLVYAGVLLVASLCCIRQGKKSKSHPCTKGYYCLWPMPIGVLFTLQAIIASGVVLAGSTRFNSRANSVKSIIEETARRASGTIYNVTRSVQAMQEDAEVYGVVGGSTGLTVASSRLNGEASNIQRKAEKNVRLISRGLKILHVTTIVIISLILVAVLAMLGSGFVKLRWPFHLLITLSWLLTVLCWASFGLYFFLHRFAGDTCVALGEFRQDPRSSSLGTILPCTDQDSVKSVLRDTRAGIHDVIDQVNANISALQYSDRPNIAYVCNPFSAAPDYNYQPDNCSANQIRIGDIPQILKRYTCSLRDGRTCGDGEFISASDYSRVLVYTTSVQDLLNSFPGVEKLVNCQLVKDAFSDILSTQCRPLKKYAHMAWAAMAALSTIMSILVLTWAVIARHDSKHHSSDVNPRLPRYTSALNDDTNKTVTSQKGPPMEP